jgi:sugar/nucleoside kinase (ribokinase family)
MVSADGERTMFTDRGANSRLRIGDLPVSLLPNLDEAAVLVGQADPVTMTAA